MKGLILFFTAATLMGACRTSKPLHYNFESQSVVDSITTTLQKHQHAHGVNYLQTKWFALARNVPDGFEIIINENLGGKNFPFNGLLNRTNRVMIINDQLRIPVIFDIDFVSDEFKRVTTGTVNFGGYYFKIVKGDGGIYKVSETAVLF